MARRRDIPGTDLRDGAARRSCTPAMRLTVMPGTRFSTGAPCRARRSAPAGARPARARSAPEAHPSPVASTPVSG